MNRPQMTLIRQIERRNKFIDLSICVLCVQSVLSAVYLLFQKYETLDFTFNFRARFF